MQAVLSSWKEVARHQGLVLAFPEELNAWISSRTSLKTSDDEQQLHGEVSQLREEGVRIIFGQGQVEPHEPGTGGDQIDTFPWTAALESAENATR